MDLLDVLWLALADDNLKLRQEFPEVFLQVEEIKSQPRSPYSHRFTMQYNIVTQECPYCGNDFLPTYSKQVCCTVSCGNLYKTWKQRRLNAIHQPDA